MSLQRPPYLLPQNRKLRHLRGIYLRNLTFKEPARAAADTAAGYKPAKTSASLLSSSPASHGTFKARNRRVTLSGASSYTRQRILELSLESHTADAFFSLHCDGIDEPIYVSEVQEKANNFNFRFFDLSDLDSRVSRSSRLTTKIWVYHSGSWSLLVQDEVDLRFLGWIESFQGVQFPANCLLFHLADGVYIAGTGHYGKPRKPGPSLPTSSYTALVRLCNLSNSIQDSLATQDKLMGQIDGLVTGEVASELPNAMANTRRVAKGVAHQKRLAEVSRKKLEDVRASNLARHAAIAAGRQLQQKAWSDVEHATVKLISSKLTAQQTRDEIRGQRRRICEDLIKIFAIGSTASLGPLQFQICGIPLPNTEYNPTSTGSGTGEDMLSAALGYVAMLANALQSYLSVALPYKILAFGSRSVIRDDISKLPDQQREFPLYIPKGGINSHYRFDYGWFLLNKDIETLCNAQELKVMDIRHTLPNLKYLLYVCSSGSDELPQRKAGGIRGLQIQSRAQQTPTLAMAGSTASSLASRRSGDARSDRLSAREEKTPPDEGGDYDFGQTSKKATAAALSGLSLPFDEDDTALTLRTKGLRENIE